jgi:hypothetical protein
MFGQQFGLKEPVPGAWWAGPSFPFEGRTTFMTCLLLAFRRLPLAGGVSIPDTADSKGDSL